MGFIKPLLFPEVCDDVMADRGKVVKQPYAEGKDSGVVKVQPDDVAHIGQAGGQQGVGEKAGEHHHGIVFIFVS